jgi:NRAMP (natural resistance-associated macrophage protein)-like metal ion transporter
MTEDRWAGRASRPVDAELAGEPLVAPPLEGEAPDGTAAPFATLEREPNRLVRLAKVLGPGLITGAADDDPSAVSTYVVAGATLGFAPLWTAPVTMPLMATVVYLCGKLGMVSGLGLGGVLRRHFPRWVLYPVVAAFVTANTLNAAADLGAIAAGINLLLPIPHTLLVVAAALAILGLQVFGSYETVARGLRWLSLALLGYIASSILAQPDWGQVLRATLIPTVHLDRGFISTLVAILGTTMSPYLFFWQAGQQVEEEITLGRLTRRRRKGATDTELKYLGWDINAGMLFGNLVMYFIILGSAATLHQAGQSTIQSAADAAQALRPLAGDAASILFALGFIGVGFVGVPVMTTGAAYALAEGLNWPQGLHKQPREARRFYAVIALTTLVGMALNFLGVNPIQALVGVAMINGLLMPPLLVITLLATNNRAIMGRRTNGRPLNVLGWITVLAGFAAMGGLVWTTLAA